MDPGVRRFGWLMVGSVVSVAGSAARAEPPPCLCPDGSPPAENVTYVPYQVLNAEKGDVILHKSSSGPLIDTLYRAMNLNYTHTMMVTEDHEAVAHFTAKFDLEAVPLEGVCDRHIRPDFLARLPPGHQTFSIDHAMRRYALNQNTMRVVKPNDRGSAQRAADVARDFSGTYSIGEYSDLVFNRPEGPGSMCSGMVYHAWAAIGQPLPKHHYDLPIRREVAHQIYDTVKQKILEPSLPLIPDIINLALHCQQRSADSIANQVTRCFCDLGCDNYEGGWDQEMTTGDTVSDDDLLAMGPYAGGDERPVISGGYYTTSYTCGAEPAPTTCSGTGSADGGAADGGGPVGGCGDNGPPSVAVGTASGSQWHITIPFRVIDPGGEPAHGHFLMTVRSANGSLRTIYPVTQAGGADMGSLSSGCDPGGQHSFVWDSQADGVGVGPAEQVSAMVNVTDDSGTWNYQSTDWFEVHQSRSCYPCDHGVCGWQLDFCNWVSGVRTVWCGDCPCGDGTCTPPEDRENCPADCACNHNGTCEGGNGEDCGTCAGDCPCAEGLSCVNRQCLANPCGDTSCDGAIGEDCGTCPQDCPCPGGTSCQNRQCVGPEPCGDGNCDGAIGEDCGTCAQDCPCPGGTSCQNRQCVGPTPEPCGDGNCDGAIGEDCGTCGQDCPCPGGTSCQNRQCVGPEPCGDGNCDGAIGEDCGTCPQDCPCPGGTSCQNRQCVEDCQSHEECDTCGREACDNQEVCDTCWNPEWCWQDETCYDDWGWPYDCGYEYVCNWYEGPCNCRQEPIACWTEEYACNCHQTGCGS